MFSSALKSFSSNITSSYSISSSPTSVSGHWKIYDGKKRSGGKGVSIFVFDRRSLDPSGTASSSRSGVASLKRAHDDVVDRLRKEASFLARLRHPSILELVEPVEDTRNGGLMFATEPVTASLAGLLEEKDEQEKAGGVGGRSSRYVVEDPESGGRRRRELEIDELEIQKGLLQVAKGLEFLHESAGLVHANLTPEAIFVNPKSDWKLAGLGFSTPPEHASSGVTPTLLLSEALNYDARLPRSVQLNIDYSSPDLVMDNNINVSADMFSLGLIIIALYNSPHKTPLDTSFSVSTYKRILASPSTTPTQSNNYLSTRPIPREVLTTLLPRLITRRPAQRFNAREIQQAPYFDSILVSTINFLDTLPAKTPNEKSQFLRGLPRILSQFPKSVLEKKVLPALLEETKDLEILSLVLQNIFKILGMVPNGRRTFCEKVVPTLSAVFLTTVKKKGKGQKEEQESSKEGGLLVVLENMTVVTTLSTGKEFKEVILPILFLSLESSAHSIQDAALHCLPSLLGLLDFTTVKNELFPAVAQVFSKTSSMAIKIKGLEAFNTLCGGQSDVGTTGTQSQSTAGSSSLLDKYTIQEKVVPLLKAIKTKEPAVMMAALDVFKQAGRVGDTDFLAMDVLPCLWHFSLGPLLNLEQFQAYMALIKSLSARIEQEQTRKLSDLTSAARGGRATGFGGAGFNGVNGGEETDFESLVTGRQHVPAMNAEHAENGWSNEPSPAPARMPQTTTAHTRAQQVAKPPPEFSWSTPSQAAPTRIAPPLASTTSRTVTPDLSLSSFTPLTPASSINTMTRQPPLPAPSQNYNPAQGWNSPAITKTAGTSLDWTTAASTSNTWAQPTAPSHSFQGSWGNQPTMSNSFSNMSIAPPAPASGFVMPKPPAAPAYGSTSNGFGQTQKQGMDKYESLL